MRRAVVHGSVMASFTVEDFSLNRLCRLERPEIAERVAAFQDLIGSTADALRSRREGR